MAAVIISFPVVASAQMELLNVPPPPPPVGNFQVVRPVLESYADCLVRKEADKIEEILATPPMSSESDLLVRSLPLKYGPCIAPARAQVIALSRGQPRPYHLSIGATFRGEIVEALYRRDFAGRNGVASRSAPVSLPSWAAGTYRADREQHFRTLYCAAVQRPALFRDLLASRVESADEAAAIQALAPAIRKCLPSGATFRLSPTWTRVVAAEAIYRASVARLAAHATVSGRTEIRPAVERRIVEKQGQALEAAE